MVTIKNKKLKKFMKMFIMPRNQKLTYHNSITWFYRKIIKKKNIPKSLI